MICVIGAGVVGCASAYQLVREGHDVLLLDAAPGPGQACSFANGAQLSYSYVEPLATPAMLRALPKLLMRRDSPVRFRPTLDWRQYAWGLQFLAACRASQVHSATRQLLALSFLSRDTLDQWLHDGVWPVGFKRNGKLVLCPDNDTMARQRRQMHLQALLGCEQQAIGVEQCLEKEPALLAAVRRSPKAYVGGIWTPGECVVDTHALCGALVDRLHARGGRTLFRTRVTGFVQSRQRVHAVLTAEGQIDCDAVVLAAGAESAILAQSLGEYLPVYPIKGYSLTLPMQGAEPAPRISVTDLGRKTVFAPLGAELRVAAIAEIGGHALDLAAERIGQMRSSVAALYPAHVDAQAHGRPWSGLRPATPTSVPIVRRSKRHTNVFFNVGHGALGLTLAAGAAVMLHRCVCESGP
jgi:D-amino-acid dehydrogenase